ncbi:MAG: F0F1 ATP synthase subunit A [Acidobacteria bacterium]|nr:F0F1 ATP synthase subunit A [Acidobacteriota bacterium]
MEHEFFFAQIFNRYLAHPLLGREIPDHVIMVLYAAVFLIVFSAVVSRKFSVDKPTRIQQLLELAVAFVVGLMREIIGPGGERFFPLLGSLGLFILVCNLMGLIPGFLSPTSNINVTLGLALVVFVYYNAQGVKEHGVLKYLRHFAGPSLLLAPLLFIIEIISHLARPFSLSVRLFGNILSEELILSIINGKLFPFVAALPVMLLALVASTIQAFIFITLTMVYLAGAVEHGPEAEAERGHAG